MRAEKFAITIQSTTINKEENYNNLKFKANHYARHTDSERKETLRNDIATIFN